jgi:tetratricopeptide (TPR) repeat protein
MKTKTVHSHNPDRMAKKSNKIKAPRVPVPATDAVAQRPPSWLGSDWFWALILVLAVILTYLPLWRAGFIWDDDTLVTANPCIVGPLGLKEIWTTSAADICPLTITTFWVEHALWGLAPLPYHLMNVLLHAASAVLLWRILRGLRVLGAWLGAALWAVHPLQVESVAWIAEMKNTESGLFFLLSILFFVRWLRARNLDGRTGGVWNYAFTLLFAGMSIASKSSTVILPVVLCLCAWRVEARWRWRNVARVAPILLMSAATGVLSMWTQNLQIADNAHWVQSWPERLVTAGYVVWFYLGKLLWPHPLITIYPHWVIDAGQAVSYLPLLVVIIVLFIFWLKRESWSRPWFFAFAYFLVTLFPVLGLVTISYFGLSFVADHFQYLANMGPLALVGAGAVRLADFVIPGRSWLQSSLCAGLLIVLGMLSWHRVWAYESEETLWTDTLAKNPSCWLGYNNLGKAFLEKGQMDKAMGQFQKALELNPDSVQAENNLGHAFLEDGQVDKAMAQLQKASEIDPNYAEARNNLGIALSKKGEVDEAIVQYQKALELNPNYAKAHNNLGIAFFKKGKVDEAIAQYQKTLAITPNYAEAHYNLGAAHFQKGQVDEAIAQYQRALEINPNFVMAHNNLGIALFQNGQVDEAIKQYQKALELDPKMIQIHRNLAPALAQTGIVLLQEGRLDEAIAQFQEALKSDPTIAQAHSDLGIAFAQKGQADEAMAQFQEALRLRPDDSAAQVNLAKIKAMLQQKTGSQ